MESPLKSPGDIFEDKEPFSEGFVPDEIIERDDILEQYGQYVQDIVDGFGPNNVFCYGQTGIGKTAVTKVMMNFLEEACDEAGVDLTIVQINCNKRNTVYSVLVALNNRLRGDENQISTHGYHPQALWEMLYERMDEIGGDFLIILDEIDKLEQDDELLYDFPRARAMGELEDARVGIIGISNNFKYRERLSQQVKSTLCEKELKFDPYDANELRSILRYYADLAFYDGVLEDDVIPLCAAFAAQDAGDARQALDLLETAGDIARHNDADMVREEHVRMAEDRVDRGSTIDTVQHRLTTQMQLTLLSTTLLVIDPDTPTKIKHIYSLYQDVAETVGADVLSESRIRDHLGTLDMFGLIEAEERNLGRAGGRAYIYDTVGSPRTIIDAFRDEELERFHSAIPDGKVDRYLEDYEEDESSSYQSQL